MNVVKYMYVEIGYTYKLFVALLIKHNIKKTFYCIVMKSYLSFKGPLYQMNCSLSRFKYTIYLPNFEN